MIQFVCYVDYVFYRFKSSATHSTHSSMLSVRRFEVLVEPDGVFASGFLDARFSLRNLLPQSFLQRLVFLPIPLLHDSRKSGIVLLRETGQIVVVLQIPLDAVRNGGICGEGDDSEQHRKDYFLIH